MAGTRPSICGRGLTLSASKFAGALGDSITVLPIVVALSALTELALAHALLGFAVFQAVWGVLLVAVAGHMTGVAFDTDERWLGVGMAALAIATNIGVAFLAEVGIHRGYEWWRG